MPAFAEYYPMEIMYMRENTEKLTIKELILAVKTHMHTRGYSQTSLSRNAYIHNELLKHCNANGIEHFTAEIGQRFMSERYGLEYGVSEGYRKEVRRAITMLSDFQQLGTIMLKRKKVRIFPKQFLLIQSYLDEYKRSGVSENYFKTCYTIMHRLFDFLDEQGVQSFSEITTEHLLRYTQLVVSHYSKASICNELREMRRIFKFLFEKEVIQKDLSVSILHVNSYAIPKHLPSTFTAEQIEAMLKTVDRSSPLGKRDYAILIIAVRLGLRSSDIRNLKFNDIDWEQNLIRISQVKTGQPLILPLTQDVGWALIDYIRYGRPNSNFEEIFLQNIAPHEPFQNLDNTLVRAMRKAKIKFDTVAHHGLHALRHSLASTMLENETPIHVIQEVLGHLNARTTSKYTSIDIKQLKTCALEVPL